MEIAVYSGSFDPLHTGHACLASWTAQFCAFVDEVWLLVSPRNPLKPQGTEASEEDRLAMATLVADTLPGVRVSDFEFSLPRPSYTHLTLRRLSEAYPQHRFRLLIGSDNWLIFDRWKNYGQIIRDFGVLIYQRPGYPVEADALPAGVTLLSDAPQFDISSTFIRRGIAEGRDMNYFVPHDVYKYVCRHKLYTDGKD